MYYSFRGIRSAVVLFAFTAALPHAAMAQFSCEFAEREPKPVRAQSEAALLPDIEVTCAGGSAGSLSLMMFLSADVVTLPGEPPAYLLVGAGEGDTIHLPTDGMAAEFDVFSGRNPVWTGIPYEPPADGAGPFRLRIVNLWVDATTAPPNGVVDIAGQLNGGPAGRPVNLPALAVATLDPRTLRVNTPSAGGGRASLDIFEDLAGALAPAAPVGASLEPVAQNVVGASYRSESGYMSDPAEGARTATRLLLRMSPDEDVGSLEVPGRISLLPGGAELRLVADAESPSRADGSFVGGSDTERYAIAGGTAGYEALYEFVPVAGYDPASAFSASLEFTIGCEEDATGPWSGSLHFAPFAAPVVAALSDGDRLQDVSPAPLPAFAEEAVAEFAIDLDQACTAAEPPRFSRNAVLNAASFRQPLAPGIMATVFPANLTAASHTAPSIPLPTQLDGIEVHVDDVPAPLFFTSGSQINFQVPWGGGAGSTFRSSEKDQDQQFVAVALVRDGIKGGVALVPIETYSPALVTLDFGPGRALAVNPDGTIAQRQDRSPIPARPAVAGEVLLLFATGLGPSSPAAISGDDSTDAEGNFVLRELVTVPTVRIGGVDSAVVFAGMSPQFVGVAQLNVIVPSGVSGDEVSLDVRVEGAGSREDVTIAVE